MRNNAPLNIIVRNGAPLNIVRDSAPLNIARDSAPLNVIVRNNAMHL